jgi:hypothetical protein
LAKLIDPTFWCLVWMRCHFTHGRTSDLSGSSFSGPFLCQPAYGLAQKKYGLIKPHLTSRPMYVRTLSLVSYKRKNHASLLHIF